MLRPVVFDKKNLSFHFWGGGGGGGGEGSWVCSILNGFYFFFK